MSPILKRKTARSYAVAVYGIPTFEQQIIARIFALTTAREQSFELAAADNRRGAHIMLVDIEDPAAVAAWEAALAAAGSRPPPSVMVARDEVEGSPYCLRRPFIASRLLRVLDAVVDREINRSDPAQPSPPVKAKLTENAARKATAAAAPKPRYRALVVDDSLSVRKQVGLVLSRVAIEADFAESGEAALQLVRERVYDIVFLDVMMPGMDGYDVCKSIKRDRQRKQVPVIMLTGKTSPFDKVKGKLAGCDTYLTKPVSRQNFITTVAKYLKRSPPAG